MCMVGGPSLYREYFSMWDLPMWMLPVVAHNAGLEEPTALAVAVLLLVAPCLDMRAAVLQLPRVAPGTPGGCTQPLPYSCLFSAGAGGPCAQVLPPRPLCTAGSCAAVKREELRQAARLSLHMGCDVLCLNRPAAKAASKGCRPCWALRRAPPGATTSSA